MTENRKKGSLKASRTCKAKQRIENEDDHCGMCGILYEEETDEIEQWIACVKCSIWYHWKCVNGVTEPESFVCSNCN